MPEAHRDDVAMSRFWNELTREERADPGELDAAAAETIRRVQDLAAAPLPAAARERARQRLLAQIDQASKKQPRADRKSIRPLHSLIGPNGQAGPAEERPLVRWPAITLQAPGSSRRRWMLGQLATAALLLLTLLGGVLALRVIRPGIVAGPGGPLVETLLDDTVEVEGTPGSWTPFGVEQWTFQPGAATLTVPAIAGPQWVVADGGAFLVAVDGVERTLAPGEGLVVPAGQTLVLRNLENREATVLRGVAATGFVYEEYDRGAITRRTALNTLATLALPTGRSRVVFARLTLLPGIALPPVATGEFDWFGVMAGRLGMTLTGDKLPAGWQSGVEREVGAFEQWPRLVPATGLTLRNIGDESLVVLRLTVTSGPAVGTTPAVAGATTPSG